MSIWLSKHSSRGNFITDREIVDKLLIDGCMLDDVLMVSERVSGTTDEIVYVWLKQEKLSALFQGFGRSQAPTATQPTLLAGEQSVYDQHFPSRS
jgi:hypothetical protein